MIFHIIVSFRELSNPEVPRQGKQSQVESVGSNGKIQMKTWRSSEQNQVQYIAWQTIFGAAGNWLEHLVQASSKKQAGISGGCNAATHLYLWFIYFSLTARPVASVLPDCNSCITRTQSFSSDGL